MDNVDPNDPKVKSSNIRLAIVLGAVALSFFGFFIWFVVNKSA